MKKRLIALGIVCTLIFNLAYAVGVPRRAPIVYKRAPGEAVNPLPPRDVKPVVREAPGQAIDPVQRVTTVPMGERTNNPIN